MTKEEIEKMNALASQYCDHDINRDRSSFRLGYESCHEAAAKEIAELRKQNDELATTSFAMESNRLRINLEKLQAELAEAKKLITNMEEHHSGLSKEFKQVHLECDDLKKRLHKFLMLNIDLEKQLASQKQAAEKLVEALEFYANGGHLKNTHPSAYIGAVEIRPKEFGERARSALAAFRKGEGG